MFVRKIQNLAAKFLAVLWPLFPHFNRYDLMWAYGFLAHNSAIFYPIWIKNCIQVLGFGHVEVIWHHLAKTGPNMGVAALRAPVGG